MRHVKKDLAGLFAGHSIKQEIALVFIAVMTGTIVLCWIINNIFLENFYIQNKKNAIKDAYYRINEVVTYGGISSDAFRLELRKTCDMYNIGLLVIDAASNTQISSTRDADKLQRRLYDNFFSPGNDIEYLDEGSSWYMAKVMDQSTYTEYLEMWGLLEIGRASCRERV